MGMKRPFITFNGLNLPGPVTAIVRIRGGNDDPVAFTWRESGQKDFPGQQRVTIDLAQSGEWQKWQVILPAKEKIIHVRLYLPTSGADIQSIEFQDDRGKPIMTWRFAS
jgi:hypothetical protein